MYLCINKLVSNHLTSFTYTSFIKALPDLTTAYNKTWSRWAKHAAEKEWQSMPAAPKCLAAFLANYGDNGATAAQIAAVTAAVAHKHAEASLPSPTTNSAVKKVLAGLKRATAKPTVQREPITFDILRKMGGAAREVGTLQAWRTFWRINMEFYGLLRWDEVSNIRIKDIAVGPEHMDIQISKSKTDQLKRGTQVRISRQTNEPHACPVNITLMYIRMLRYPEGHNGYMQPRICTRGGQQKGIPDTKLCYSNALQELKEMLNSIGIAGQQYGEHSGRRGGATAAAEAGAKWTDLKKHGRWNSDTAPQLYIENTERRKSEVPRLLAAAAANTNCRPFTRIQEPRRQEETDPIRVSRSGITLPPCQDTPDEEGPLVMLPPVQE